MKANTYFIIRSVISGMGDIGVYLVLIAGLNYFGGRDGWSNFDFLVVGNVMMLTALAGYVFMKRAKIKWS